MAYNIAIDGPAGAGKSTIAKKLAADLGYVYVDTGAMYRAMAYYFLQNGIDAKDENAIADACSNVDVTIQYVNGEQQVILNGENVNGVIRKEEVGNMASATSVYPVVRTKLVELQRQLASKENVIMDGRDIGTVVLPNANVKIYLTASSAVRAKRRFDELTAKGVDFISIKESIDTSTAQGKFVLTNLLNGEKNIYDVLNLTMEDLLDYFSVRTYNCLKRAGINTVRNIVSMTEYDLKSIRNLGERTFNEIVSVIEDMGLHLGTNYDGEDDDDEKE